MNEIGGKSSPSSISFTSSIRLLIAVYSYTAAPSNTTNNNAATNRNNVSARKRATKRTLNDRSSTSLNGSGLAVGRLMIALLENNQKHIYCMFKQSLYYKGAK